MKGIILFLMIFVAPVVLHAQEALLKSFSAQQQDEDIIITWIIGKGNQCSDVEVQHSTDSVNFTVVYSYPGICGSNDESVSYSWLHTDPLPGKKNYYRITLPGGYSQVVKVDHHSFENKGYVATPVPATGPVTIFFRNSENTPHTLVLFDVSGREVQKITGITSGAVTIHRTFLRKGIYLFRLFDNASKVISGKIIFL